MLYIDACIRDGQSRTKQIAEPILAALSERYRVTRLTLNDLPLAIVDKDLLARRQAGDIPTGHPLEQATSYLKALSWLWGIGPLEVVAAQNLVYLPESEIRSRIRTAVALGLEIVETF